MEPIAPTDGHIIDLENLTLCQKLSYIDGSTSLRCHQKFSLLDEHSSWQLNGLSSLKYELLNIKILSPICKIYTVNIMLNNHWTDKLCHISSTADDHEAVIANLKSQTTSSKRIAETEDV